MRRFILVSFLTIVFLSSYSQVSVQMSGTENRICNGVGCNYSGPSILINEVMLSPYSGDGSIYGTNWGTASAAGEWIELYNPDKCKSVDISCYFLGNYTLDGINPYNYYPGGFSIPPGTVVPPQGFAVIRGENAVPVPSYLLVANGGKTVEVVVRSRVCIGGGSRLWFPNSGGWFAFYDRNGIPQDAISWAVIDPACVAGNPCNPLATGCGYTGTIPSYNDIPANKKTRISDYSPSLGLSFRRIPDGGDWGVNQPSSPTIGNCNSICNPEIVVTCAGRATATASGGTQPYTYLWDDGQGQTTATAVGLCAGTYCVTVTDALGITATGCYTVEDYVPAVSHPDVSLCGNEMTVQLSGGTPAGGLYSGTGVTGTQFDVYGSSDIFPVTYSYTDYNECSNTAEFLVKKLPVPQLAFTYSDTICKGEVANLQLYSGAEEVDITVFGKGDVILFEDRLPAGTVRNYELYPELTSSYSIHLVNHAGCENTYDFKVVVLELPIVEFSGLVRIPEQILGKTELSVNPGYASYLWNTGDSASSIVIYEAGIYSVMVSNRFGCTQNKEIEIFVIPKDPPVYIPNAFVPSSDDNRTNCFFVTGLENYFDISVSIFNRWGQEVYQSNDPHFRWNGAMNGVLCPYGVYVWHIVYHNYFGKQYTKTGVVTLVR